ncbi:MAG: IS21 family transposase, partial [Acidobacteriota bacterium]|nr:IS21 family transposase [Acidobacteriota bacterium]
MSEWFRARVNIDYHIAFDSNYYSVSYKLVHELVEGRTTPTTIEVLHKGQRVASHCVHMAMGARSRFPSTGHAPTKRIWTGRHRGWCT